MCKLSTNATEISNEVGFLSDDGGKIVFIEISFSFLCAWIPYEESKCCSFIIDTCQLNRPYIFCIVFSLF